MSFRIHRRDLAMEGEGLEGFGTSLAEAGGESFAEVALRGEGFIFQTATGPESAGVTGDGGDPFAGAELCEVPGDGLRVIRFILEGGRDGEAFAVLKE